ncbi:MAG: S8/S53 family peptidase [Oscillospiraceae bacterium]|nr:S8/S53 family peptidase [Oscillospiraceae bacterium]
MKRIISFIISITMFLSFMPAYAENNVSSVDYPAEGAELGYLFSLKSTPNADFDVNDYAGIEVVSEMANIYYADTIADIKAIENIVDIDIVAANWVLSEPEPITEPMYDDTAISLFAVEDEGNIEETDDVISDIDEDIYPNDPLLERQWYYEAVKGYAFRNNNITGEGIKVGIIDSGLTKDFKTFHDFEGVDIQTGINVCAKLDKNEEYLYGTEDNQTHGTSVASVICSKTDNEHGIAGLVDGCTVIPYKIEDRRFSEFANSGYAFITAIDMAYQDGCDVLNISRGSTDTPNYQIELENQVIDKATQNGMIIVAAVGNDGDTTNAICHPAACDNTVGVGSIEPACDTERAVIDGTTEMIKSESEYTENDKFYTGWLRSTLQNLPDNAYKKANSSTANESVFVCAPGSSMTLAYPSSLTTKNYNILSGTSFATPIVASAAIGVKQMRPYVDVDMFKEILMETAVDLEDEGYDINTGYGMVNFERIYNYVSQMPLTAPERIPEVTIDYENEQLVGFPINREYTINGEDVAVSEDGTFPIAEEWFGTTIEIIKKASSDSYTDSEPQMLDIPVRLDCPDTVYGTETGIANDNKDMISYKPVNGGEWVHSNVFVSLPTGMYLVKLASTSTSFGGLTKTIYVGRQNLGIEVDYKNELLINFESNINYTVNGETAEINNKSCPIAAEWFGATVSVVRKAANSNDVDITQELSIPTRPVAPELSGDKGKLVGTTRDMEYCKQGSKQWISCSDGETLLGSSAGVYQVRIKQSDTNFVGEIAIVQVGLVIPTAEIDYKNETLKNFENGESYTINGQDIEIDNRTYPIPEEWLGTTVSIVRKASEKYMNDSEPQMLDIPARPAAPEIYLLSDNTVNISANIIYKEKNTDTWQKNSKDTTITLEQSKTYVFRTQYTENSFASEIAILKVENTTTSPAPTAEPITTEAPTTSPENTNTPDVGLDIEPTPTETPTEEPPVTPTEEPVDVFDIETGIFYGELGECTYSAVNNTDTDIEALGIIAIYGSNGALKHLETIDMFPVGSVNKKLNFPVSNGDTISFFIWDSLQSMQPIDKVKLSKLTISFGN